MDEVVVGVSARGEVRSVPEYDLDAGTFDRRETRGLAGPLQLEQVCLSHTRGLGGFALVLVHLFAQFAEAFFQVIALRLEIGHHDSEVCGPLGFHVLGALRGVERNGNEHTQNGHNRHERRSM